MPKKKGTRAGRPLEKGEKRSRLINFKTTPTLHGALQEEADKNGRSLSKEIEWRLERSIKIRRGYVMQIDAEAGPEMHLQAIGFALFIAEGKTGKKWTQDKETFALAKKLVGDAMDHIRKMESAT